MNFSILLISDERDFFIIKELPVETFYSMQCLLEISNVKILKLYVKHLDVDQSLHSIILYPKILCRLIWMKKRQAQRIHFPKLRAYGFSHCAQDASCDRCVAHYLVKSKAVIAGGGATDWIGRIFKHDRKC